MLAALLAFAFPMLLAPAAPFPLVTGQARFDEPVAPGVARVAYHLRTSAGPLAVHAIVLDPHEPTVRLDTVLGRDRVAGPGEPVSAMAARTNAVAGINGDFFDTGTDGAPIGVVVRGGRLLRSPSRRAAFSLARDRSAHVGTIGFSGSVRSDAGSAPLTGVDVYPPEGGASLLTAAYGMRPRATDGVHLAALAPVSAIDGVTGSYRVTALGADPAGAGRGPLLALGPAALATFPAPQPGDLVAIVANADPYPLGDLLAAIGGGPRLVADGAPVDDPDAPAPEFRDKREPVAGVGVGADGSVILVVVDGRAPASSVGLTRPEFGALFRALGAVDAMGFDGGGSATLVARALGESGAGIVNVPSDGVERPVADGLFVYSDAPVGPPARLVVRPERILALPGAEVALRAALVDAAQHRVGTAQIAGSSALATIEGDRLRVGKHLGSGDVPVRATGGLPGGRATIALRVVAQPARLEIAAAPENPDPGTRVRLSARGYDPDGVEIALGPVAWSAGSTAVAPDGTLTAPAHDPPIVARAGGTLAHYELRVGRREIDQPIFADAFVRAWTFVSAPAGAPGDVALGDDALHLRYDLTSPATRAAYAVTKLVLPEFARNFSVEVTGDGSGVVLRARLRGRDGVTALRTVGTIGFRGPRRLAVPLDGGDLLTPVTLTGLYVLPSLGGAPPVRSAGTLVFRDARVTVPGTP